MPAEDAAVKISVRVAGGPVPVRAYSVARDTASLPTDLLDVSMPQWPSHELLGVLVDRIKHLGESLIALHGPLAQQPAARK